MKLDEEIVSAWTEVINNDEFLSRMLTTIQIKSEMSKGEFINHIIYSSGNSNTNNLRAGASAIIEIFKLSQLVVETDGK